MLMNAIINSLARPQSQSLNQIHIKTMNLHSSLLCGLRRRHGRPGQELARHLGSLFFLLFLAFDLNLKNHDLFLELQILTVWKSISPAKSRAGYFVCIHFKNSIYSFTQVRKQRKPCSASFYPNSLCLPDPLTKPSPYHFWFLLLPLLSPLIAEFSRQQPLSKLGSSHLTVSQALISLPLIHSPRRTKVTMIFKSQESSSNSPS